MNFIPRIVVMINTRVIYMNNFNDSLCKKRIMINFYNKEVFYYCMEKKRVLSRIFNYIYINIHCDYFRSDNIELYYQNINLIKK